MITSGPYTSLQQELQNLYDGLSRRRPRRVRVAVLARFHAFTDLQVLELMEAWDADYGQRLALDYVSLVGSRIDAEWASYIRDRIRQAQLRVHQAQVRRFRAASAEARAGVTERLRARMRELRERELAEPSGAFSRHLLHNFRSRSQEQQEAIEGLLHFVDTQPSQIPVPDSTVLLRPGTRYAWAQNRWFLGRAYGPRGAVLVWLDGDITGDVYIRDLTGLQQDIAQGMARAAEVASVWIPWGRAIALACAVVLLPLAAPVGAAPAVASRISWFFSGSRLIAGSVNAASNLINQAIEYGTDLSRYNWGSIGADYFIGAVSHAFAGRVLSRWPAPIFSPRIRLLATWRNFGIQQSLFFLYGCIVGVLRAQLGRTGAGRTVGAQQAEGILQMLKSVAMQSFVNSRGGQALWPGGSARERMRVAHRDPRFTAISQLLSIVIRLAVREVFGVRPRSGEAARVAAPAEAGE
jgi:hypothetical protein